MEADIVEPCRIDFSEDVEDEGLDRLPVYLRIKPQIEEEMSIKILNSTTVETNHPFRANKKATYTHVFPGSATQQEVFDGTSAQLMKKFLDGVNVMTFAYGVTSSGKTYTIMGSHSDPGILPRTLEIIFGTFKSKIENTAAIYKPVKFDGVQELSSTEIEELENAKAALISKVKGSTSAFNQYSFTKTTTDSYLSSMRNKTSPLPAAVSCSVWISIYEIHNEIVTDVFRAEPKSKRKALTIGQDHQGRTFVKDLLQLPVRSASEAYALLQYARQNLATASTKLNDNSSRSHMVFNLKMVHWGGPVSEPFVNQFVISDLAGSERQAKTLTSGLTLRQAGSINNSLLVLGRCLEALRKKDKGIAAPFRESKLTRMLNPFFTLGGYVSLIICVNPNIHLQDETMDTIRLSAIASEIVQDPIRPLERLRQLRRLTLDCIENSPVKMMPETDVPESWQDAVNGTAVRNGVAYLEVRTSYFNEMARDILRAEKLLTANEAEIQSLREKLKESDVSKENIKLMYQDKLKEQREKFAQQKEDLDEMHRDTQETLVEEFEEEIRNYREKYLKYKNGYAKVTDYLNNKLWPEISLFRERFGYLQEFPPKDETQNEEAKPENTIKYWQDKLQDMEDDYRALKTKLHNKSDLVTSLKSDLEEQRKHVITAEAELRESRAESARLASQVNQLNEQLSALRSQLSVHETLFDELSEVKRKLREADEKREALIASHQIRLNSMTEELNNLKAELREKNSDFEATSAELTSANAKIAVLDETVSSLGKPGKFGSEEHAALLFDKAKLEKKVVNLEAELSKQRQQSMELQDDILTLQEEMEKLSEKEAELEEREKQVALKLQDVRRTRTAESDMAQLMDDINRLRLALEDEKEALADKDALIVSQEAELEELRDKIATLETLRRQTLTILSRRQSQMGELSKENREYREKLKALQNENQRLEVKAKHARELEVEIESLTKKLVDQQSEFFEIIPKQKG